MNKHTPGPWSLGDSDLPVSKLAICTTAKGRAHSTIARIVIPSPSSPNEAGANVRLIAAAPELLATLQKLLSHGTFDDYPNTTEWYAVRDARAAIAKATGDQA
jgi:hypothetical protein